MPRYIEYEKASGRILSEVTSPGQPDETDGICFLEVPEDADGFDTTEYAVKSGKLERLKKDEDAQARAERERVRQEHRDEIHLRLKGMMYELLIAIFEDDNTAIEGLRKEYKELKVYMR